MRSKVDTVLLSESDIEQVMTEKDAVEIVDKTYQGFGEGKGSGGFDFNSFRQGNFDFSDFGLEDLFEDFFGGRKQSKRNINRGEDIEIALEISLEDVLKTANRNIVLNKMVKCARCQGNGAEPGSKVKECFSCRGTGFVQQMKRTVFGTITKNTVCPECQGEGKMPEKPCNVCKGEGRIEDNREINFFIPQGIDSGQTIKFDEQGNAGRKGAKPGNLYIKVFVKKHPIFKRRGDDLYLFLPISFSQAVLGDEIELKTLDSKQILLKIPKGIESGKVLRISSKGLPHFSGFGKGNLYVQLIIKTPAKINKKQKALLEKLKQEGL